MQNKYDDTEEIIINQDSIEYEENKISNIEEDIKIIKNAIKCNKKQFEEIGTHILLQDDEQKAIEHILSEREQDKKRIKELEEENRILEFQNEQVENYVEELKKYNKTVSDRIVEYKKDSIPKQKVKDKIDKHKYAKECFEKEYVTKKYKDEETRTRDFYMIVAEDLVIINLQELLEDK